MREAAYEESAVTGVETIIPGEQDTEAVKAGKKTIETIKGAERIMEAIELYKEERQKELEHKASQVTKDKTLPKLLRECSKMVFMKSCLWLTKYFRFWPRSRQHPAQQKDLLALFVA
ncbi:WD repeat-containing protein 3-like [Xenia sp. Carnegie-2017]|uniref:WD repeat-containing protein 3-like n=1 Tax=Xenia sp. Carnegie-2017 TaxID=2897299 RepID=UPI001F03C7E1|nr:WD repeat-containing protein 3-like [Xenia sp. Carnegie-2017]